MADNTENKKETLHFAKTSVGDAQCRFVVFKTKPGMPAEVRKAFRGMSVPAARLDAHQRWLEVIERTPVFRDGRDNPATAVSVCVMAQPNLLIMLYIKPGAPKEVHDYFNGPGFLRETRYTDWLEWYRFYQL